MKNPLRVLFIENAVSDAELVVHELMRGGFAVEWEGVSTPASLADALARRGWDVVISDYRIPELDAEFALQMLRERGLDLPFIVFSGQSGDDEAVRAMKAGAHDYVMKDKPARLLPAVERELREAEVRQERRQTQEALRESEQRYKSLFDNNPDAVFSLDREGSFLSANPAAEKLFGYAAAELRRMSFPQLCAPEHLKKTRQVFEEGSQGAITDLETALICRDGRRVELFVTGGPIVVDGQIVAIFGVAKDITERKLDQENLRRAHKELERRVRARTAELAEANQRLRAEIQEHERTEGALRETEDRYRCLVEVCPEAILIHRDHKIVFINRAGLQLFGAVSPQQILGKSPFDLVHPDSQPLLKERFRYAMLHGQTVPLVEEKIIRLDGTVIDAEVAASPFPDQGKTSIQVVLRDITGRKRLEKEILETSERERQRMGRDLHDGLCQHLTGVKFKSSLLELKLAEQGRPEAREARAIARLMNQALQEARNLAQGLHPVKLEAHGLMSALQELAARIEMVFHITCICRFRKPVLMHDNAAAIHLYRIAQEAISNAIKHGKAKTIRLGLSATPSRIALTVQDDGVGFPAKPRRKKNGMGLHLMHHRARLVGANLVIEPAPGGGALLTCTWPLPTGPAPRKSSHARPG